MIVHRDYRSSADSVVKIFQHKIEFFNPGKLPDEITVEDLLNNTYISNPRNKLIADLFKDLGHIEKYGSGIKRIINLFENANLPMPEFKNSSGGFLVTVYKNMDNSDTASIINETVGETAQEIAQEIAQETAQEIQLINTKITVLLNRIGNKQLSLKEMLAQMQLKHAKSFKTTYLQPAMELGLISLLYLNNPTHRNQRYYLTRKGLKVLNSSKQK